MSSTLGSYGGGARQSPTPPYPAIVQLHQTNAMALRAALLSTKINSRLQLTFTTVDIGAYGSQNVGGVLWNSGFGKRLLNGSLDLPEDAYLPETCITFPYFVGGDAAFSP